MRMIGPAVRIMRLLQSDAVKVYEDARVVARMRQDDRLFEVIRVRLAEHNQPGGGAGHPVRGGVLGKGPLWQLLRLPYGI